METRYEGNEHENRPKPSRKRKRNPMRHQASIRKELVQSGKQHQSSSNKEKIIPAKVFSGQVNCICKMNCAKKIDIFRQKTVFEQFYNMKTWSQKTLYLRSLVNRNLIRDNLNPIISLGPAKKYKCKYSLNDANGVPHQVCLKFLSKCLCISDSTIKKSMKYAQKNPEASERRGNSKKKYEERHIDYVKKFIESFPAHKSHYNNSSTSNKKYLSPYMNIRRMYKEYRLKCIFMRKKTVVPEWLFRKVFNTEFNLSFKRLIVDSCNKCDMIHAKFKSVISAEEHSKIEKMQEAHRAIVKKNKQDFKECISRAKLPESKEVVLVFDLQKALAVPLISTNEAFYRRQLWCYNLCVFNEVTNEGFMYVWDESIGSRGAQEIGSCLLKHFQNYIPKDTRKLTLWSDTCAGQNRNIKIALILKHFLANICIDSELQCIEQQFFVSGHSYNSCDRCFATIENQKKVTEDIFIPDHWYNLIARAKKREPKFVVLKMKRCDFYSSKELEELIVNRKTSIDGKKICWLRIKTIIYDRSDPLQLCIKEYSSIDSPKIFISLQKNRASKDFPDICLEYLYKKNRAITYEKYKDLTKLIKYIPDKFHHFYETLKHLPKKRK